MLVNNLYVISVETHCVDASRVALLNGCSCLINVYVFVYSFLLCDLEWKLLG